MTQISAETAYSLLYRLLRSAAEYRADVIAVTCPMCQLNLDGYQGQVNRTYKTDFDIPILYFTQLMGVAFELDPESLGLGRELVSSEKALAKVGVAAPAPASRSPCSAGGQEEGRQGAPHASPVEGRRAQTEGEAMSDTNSKSEGPRIGVYVCHCGSNIAGVVDVAEVARWAGASLPGVVVARDYKFMCSSLGQELIQEDIKKDELDRVVVAACSPHLHERTFRKACRARGRQPVPLPDGQHPRARLLGHRGQGRRHGQGASAMVSAPSDGSRHHRRSSRCQSRSTRRRWSSAAASPASRPPSNWPTPATTSTWSSASPPSAGTWRSSTRRFRRSTARPAS